MQELYTSIVEQINNHQINLERLILLQFVLGTCLLIYYVVGKRLLPYLYKKGTISEEVKVKLRNIVRWCFFLATLILAILLLGLNIGVPDAASPVSVVNTLLAFLIIQIARFFDFFFGKVVNRYYSNLEEVEDHSLIKYTKSRPEQVATRSLQYAVYTLAIIVILKNFELDFELFSFQAGENTYPFKISSIFAVILIFLIARLLIWMLTQIFLSNYYRVRSVDLGSQYAINQLISYFIYVVAFVVALDNMGVQMTVLWGGLAALLVGVGLGLQQTFNDLFSGILLLFERSVEVGDVVEIGTTVGSVKRIGLRTSIIETRDNVTLILPNSKLIMDGIINWTHFDPKVRFIIGVGVAYGTDTTLVKKLLLQAVDHPKVLSSPAPLVRFTDFGNSSLDFELLFYSTNFIGIKDVKSDIRFEIDRLFRANHIEIPFPQTDIWIRKGLNDE